MVRRNLNQVTSKKGFNYKFKDSVEFDKKFFKLKKLTELLQLKFKNSVDFDTKFLKLRKLLQLQMNRS